MSGIADFHGPVSKCNACQAVASEAACFQCFGRGFVAKCMLCDGAGHTVQPMAGGPGTMKSVCSGCGGRGVYGVPKPANWTEPVEEAVTA